MEYLLFFALSGVAAVIFNWAFPQITANPQVTPYTGSYFGKTAVTAVTFFVVLIVAASLMSIVGERSNIPTPI